jgi:hypothetical protein
MTEKQLQVLKETYVESLIDTMDPEALASYVFNHMLEMYRDLNEREFIEEMSEFCDEDMVADFIETACEVA